MALQPLLDDPRGRHPVIDLLALLRADFRTAWADDRLPVIVLAVMVATVVLLAGGLGWWLLSGGYAPS